MSEVVLDKSLCSRRDDGCCSAVTLMFGADMVSDGHCQNIISYPLFVHAIRENITGEWTRIT